MPNTANTKSENGNPKILILKYLPQYSKTDPEAL